MYKRVMIKISGEALSANDGHAYNREFIEQLGQEVKSLVADGVEVAIVTGAGNFWRGARSDNRVDRVNSDNMGMLATAMNAIYIADCFGSMDVKTTVMSAIQVGGIFDMFNKQNALDALAAGKVLVFAFGTGLPFFSTDTSTAMYGSQINADLVVALKFGVDGIYTKDPQKYPNEAVFIETMSYDDIMSNNDVQVMDKAAACVCKESGLKTIVLDFKAGNIVKAVKGEKIGTLVTL